MSEENLNTEAVAEEVAPVDAAKVTDEVSNDAKIAQEIESAIKSILIKYSAIEQVIETLKSENTKMAAQLLELSKSPAAKPIKSTPTQANVEMSAYQKFIERNKKFN